MQKRLIATAAVILVAAAVAAQVAKPLAQPAPTPRPPTLADIGMFIYPAQGQAQEQMAKDQEACTRWAEAQTGLQLQAGRVDTQAAAKAAEKEVGKATEGAAIVGAAKGAAAGTAIGAIAGNTGKGAAIGAVAGAMGGFSARRHAKHEAGVQGAQKAQVQNQQALDAFKKAAGACLEGRGYSVK
jgi:hypothetical protein